MALTKYHIHEEIDGVKCSIAEKNCTKDRAEFLKNLLTYNGFEVKIGITAAPKAVAKPAAPDAAPVEAEAAPETYTVGVTDIVFNPVHALYSRLLHTPDGHVVTVAYWLQKETVSHDDVPYYQR
jgi:hypothetical protein